MNQKIKCSISNCELYRQNVMIIMKSFVTSKFMYCPLSWKFHSRALNNEISFQSNYWKKKTQSLSTIKVCKHKQLKWLGYSSVCNQIFCMKCLLKEETHAIRWQITLLQVVKCILCVMASNRHLFQNQRFGI